MGGPYGELIPPWRLSTRFTELVKLAESEGKLPKPQSGEKRIVLHGCRKTANSIWAAAGVEHWLRDAWAGWSRQSMADGTYLRIRPEVHEAGAQLVAAYRAEHGPSTLAL